MEKGKLKREGGLFFIYLTPCIELEKSDMVLEESESLEDFGTEFEGSGETPEKIGMVHEESESTPEASGITPESFGTPPEESKINIAESEEYMPTDTVAVPIVVTLCVMTIYIFLGAIVYSYWEGWTLPDSAYFCFVTLTTLGFGDMVPGQE